jgi:hypothetical protein
MSERAARRLGTAGWLLTVALTADDAVRPTAVVVWLRGSLR